MDALLDRLDAQVSSLVQRISRLEPLEGEAAAFAELDKELIAAHAHLAAQCDAARQIAARRKTSSELDAAISSTLLELAEYRKQLETPATVTTAQGKQVDSDVLLDYASRITRFTKQMPGAGDPTILPWPQEDQLRKGMLATLTIQDESGGGLESGFESAEARAEAGAGARAPSGKAAEGVQGGASTAPAEQPEKTSRREPRRRAPKKKISLDFDSDED